MARVSTVDDLQNEHFEANPLTQDKKFKLLCGILLFKGTNELKDSARMVSRR